MLTLALGSILTGFFSHKNWLKGGGGASRVKIMIKIYHTNELLNIFLVSGMFHVQDAFDFIWLRLNTFSGYVEAKVGDR
jgi:hypothetical protein